MSTSEEAGLAQIGSPLVSTENVGTGTGPGSAKAEKVKAGTGVRLSISAEETGADRGMRPAIFS